MFVPLIACSGRIENGGAIGLRGGLTLNRISISRIFVSMIRPIVCSKKETSNVAFC